MIIYTAITRGYDKLQPTYQRDGVEFHAFVEPGIAGEPPWNMRWLNDPHTALWDPCRRSKRAKVLASLHVSTDISIWIDGCVWLKREFDVNRLVAAMGDHDLAAFLHPSRDCLYDEARWVIERKIDKTEVVEQQVERYRAEGFPEHAGLAECCVVIRRHTERVAAFDEIWWDEIVRGSRRDQVSFPYAAKKAGLSWAPLGHRERRMFRRRPHLRHRSPP